MKPIILVGPTQRQFAKERIQQAPVNAIVTIKEPTRSLLANAKMWAMLHDISKAEPMGRKHTPEDWKCIFMRALEYEIRFVMGLDGSNFPVGFRSSKMTVGQMSEFIEYLLWFGAENDIAWSEKYQVPA